MFLISFQPTRTGKAGLGRTLPRGCPAQGQPSRPSPRGSAGTASGAVSGALNTRGSGVSRGCGAAGGEQRRQAGLQGLPLPEGPPDLSHVSTFPCFCAKTGPCVCCAARQENEAEGNAGNLTVRLPCRGSRHSLLEMPQPHFAVALTLCSQPSSLAPPARSCRAPSTLTFPCGRAEAKVNPECAKGREPPRHPCSPLHLGSAGASGSGFAPPGGPAALAPAGLCSGGTTPGLDHRPVSLEEARRAAGTRCGKRRETWCGGAASPLPAHPLRSATVAPRCPGVSFRESSSSGLVGGAKPGAALLPGSLRRGLFLAFRLAACARIANARRPFACVPRGAAQRVLVTA